jgi:hypothetical protein
MTEIEYEIIDELYFVTSFSDIAQALHLPEADLCLNLKNLVKRSYVKAYYPDPDTEVEWDNDEFDRECRHYFFLATKAGLIAHNSR